MTTEIKLQVGVQYIYKSAL